MAVAGGPNIVEDGLVLALDAANVKSYPGSGANWNNLAGTVTGSLVNGPSLDTDNVGSIYFDGSNDYGVIAHSDLTYDRTAFTVEVFVKPWAIHSGYRNGPFNKWNTGGGTVNEFAISFGTGSSGLAPGAFTVQSWDTTGGSYGKGAYTAGGTTNYEVGKWTHLVGTFFSGSVKFYKDGVLEGVNEDWASAYSYAKTVDTLSFKIADFNETTYFGAKANIAQIRMYSGKALTASEVLQNYNATKGRFGL